MRQLNRPHAFTIVELLVSVAIIGLLVALLVPAVQSAREAARRNQCLSNLRQIGTALHNYQDAHNVLPPFTVWGGPPGEPLGLGIVPVGVMDRVALGLAPGSEPDRTYANWMVLLLPHIGQDNLYKDYDSSRPVGDPVNAAVRTTDIAVYRCPSDQFSTSFNLYERDRLAGTSDNQYARGNYAMNFGPNRNCLILSNGTEVPAPCTDGFHASGTDLAVDNTTVWGSGVGGVNVSFQFSDMSDGLSNTVAVDEIRAGVHPLDLRGAWALGFIGASGTARHGLIDGAEDDNGPNNTDPSSDDIIGCTELKDAVTDGYLLQVNMPCFSGPPGTEVSVQATARSLHQRGVHILKLDGSADFVSDNVNPAVWHAMHTRDSAD